MFNKFSKYNLGYIGRMEESVIGDSVAFLSVRSSRWLLPAILALCFFLSVLQLFDAFSLWCYPMIHRTVIAVRFDLGFSLVPVLLPFLAVVLISMFRGQRYLEILLSSAISLVINHFFGLEAAVACFSILHSLLALVFLFDVGVFLFWLFVYLAGFEAGALFHWLLFLPLGLKTPFEYVAYLELNLSFMIINLVPYLVLSLIFICFLKPLNRLIGKRMLLFENMENQGSSIFSSKAAFFLIFIIFFSVLAAVYPYLPNVNPTGGDVGVDIKNYLKNAELVENDPTQIFKIWHGDRPLIFLIIFVFQKILNLDASTVIRFLPMFLHPLLASTVYFFTKATFNDNRTAVWASFFTVFGFPIAVGMYSYFLSNMLGLCLVYSSLGFLFKSIKEGSRVSLVLAFLFGGLLLFTHPWTFDQYFAPLILVMLVLPQIIYNSIDYKISKNILSRTRYLLIFFLVLLFIMELVKVNFFQGYGGVAALNTFLKNLTSVKQFWFHFIYPLKYRFGGLISNVILIILAMVSIFAIKLRNVPEFYLWILMVATSAILLVSDEVVKSRLLYNIPIGVLAALGYVTILQLASSDKLKLSFTSFISLSMIVYLFRSLANIIIQ